MKHSKIIGTFLLLAMLGTACKKDNTTLPTTPSTTNTIVGTWRVSSFIKDSVDLTNQFSGYTFTCNTNGTMTIHGNGQNYGDCSWNNNSSNNSMYHFHMMGCDDNSVLWEINEDWDLTNHDSSHCYFSNHSPTHNSTMIWTKS